MFTLGKYELERTRTLLSGYYVKSPAQKEDAHFNLTELLPGRVQTLLTFAGLNAAQKMKLSIRILIEISLCLFLMVYLSSWYFVPTTGVVFYIEYRILRNRIYRRAQSFEKDYTALLVSLASAVRTGIDPLVALTSSASLFATSSAVRREVDLLQEHINSGATEEQALRRFARSVQHPDIELFRAAFILARKEGSSLSTCLQRLAKVTRQRQSFRRKVRSAVAMQKLSAFGILLCTVVIGLMQAAANPDALRIALSHPTGSRLLAFGAGLIICGLGWMVSLARSRI